MPSFLEDYLAGLRRRQQSYLNPHLGDIPALGGLLGRVAPGVAATPLPGALAPLTGVSQAAAAGELSHQADTIGQLLVGAGVLGSAHIDRLTGQSSPDADAALAAASGAADPPTAFMAVHGAEAQAHPRVIGALDMAYNPLNYVAGVEGLASKLGLRGVATGARVLSEAINAPAAIAGGQVLRPLGREIAGKVSAQVPQLAARALSAAEPAAQTAARAVEGAIARGPGTPAVEEAARGLNPPLPIPPPTITAPPRAPFTPEVARNLLLDTIMQAPQAARARMLGALNVGNFGEGGAANAMRSVTGMAHLGGLGELEKPYLAYLLQRSIETPTALDYLQANAPGLHRAVDLLPDLPERTALDLQNEVRRAAGLPEKVVKPRRGAATAAAVEPTPAPAPEPVHPELLNADGTPKTLYHGTSAAFGDFEMRPGAFGTGAYFTDSPFMSTIYALGEEGGTRSLDGVLRGAEPAPNIRPAHLALRNPFLWPDDPAAEAALKALGPDALTAHLRAQGYDGVVVKNPVNPHYTEYVAFDPGQIESPYAPPAAGAQMPAPAPPVAHGPSGEPTGASAGAGGDLAAGGMGGQAPIQMATTLAGAAGGGVAGYEAAGDQASPTDRAAATLAGAAAGGTAGHLGPALLARPGESALRGIAAAGGGPVELAARGILGGDVAGKVLPFAREEALAQHVAGSQVQALLPRLRQVGGIWARNVTQTARNALQDETWLQFVLRGLQPGAAGELGTVRRAMADRLNLATEWERYPTTTTAPLEAAGVTDATLNLGQTFHGTEGYLNEVLSNTQNAIGEAGLSFLNPVRAGMNLPSVAFAGAKGYARNYQAGLFKAVNQFQQLSARHAVFADEFTARLAQAADRFLPDLERRGYDVTPLRQKLASEGAFSPDDVRSAMLGDNPAVQAWERTVGAVKDSAEARARKLLGDYSRRGVLERKAGGVVPFVSWQLRAWPVMAEMIATHPGAALAVGNLLRLSGQQVTANKEPLRNVGTIPIQTPAGTVRLNPLSAVAPGSPEMLSLGSEDPNAPEDRTAYQTASDLLQKVGLGFGPGAQALAYATSQDYKGPGPLSRTAGIENAIGQVPLVQLPSLGAAGLDAARLLLRQPIERVSAPAALPVAGAAQPDYDPNLRRAQEVYYDATGKAIGQPGTAAAAAQTLDPTSPLMSRARGDVATSGALRNALSLVLPVGVQAQTPEAARAQQARANTPISAAELARYKEESPTLYRLAQQRNAQYQAANPVAAIYEANTPIERKLTILRDWDRQHSGLLVDRRIFLARRQQVMDALGLKENAQTRFDIAELAAPAR